MNRNWTFAQKIGAGYGMLVSLVLLMCLISVLSLRSVIGVKDRIIEVDSHLVAQAERLNGDIQAKVANGRAFMITKDQEYLNRADTFRADFKQQADSIRKQLQDPEALRLLDQVQRAENDHQIVWGRLISQAQKGLSIKAITEEIRNVTRPKHEALKASINEFIAHQEQSLRQAKQDSTASANRATTLLILLAAIAIILAATIALLLTRALARQIGSAVQHVQNSASELQAAANEQASGARQQSSAISEISTTMRELLVTSRQIAQSAQRVAHISEESAGSARRGDQTVHQGQGAVATIKRQTDVIVAQTIELGQRSQQIGTVVELITELADQTNILSINASIESAGAGESGKRFAVVADEIRKLADRVGGSTKDIRALIEEIRTAVNTAVMATESGSKAVEAGTRQFADIAQALQQIVGSVTTATQAAREIELSTKQQSTAVEQVNSAISSAAQAVHQLEANSTQTLQTSSRLAGLSGDLLRLVQPRNRKAA